MDSSPVSTSNAFGFDMAHDFIDFGCWKKLGFQILGIVGWCSLPTRSTFRFLVVRAFAMAGVCFQKYDCWRTQLWPAIRVVCHTDFEQASCNFRELFVPSRCTG